MININRVIKSSHNTKLLIWVAILVTLPFSNRLWNISKAGDFLSCRAKHLILGLIIMLGLSCAYNLKYIADINFIPSAAANSPEYLVTLNDKTCKDIDNIVGLCAKRIKRNEDLRIGLLAQDYSYTYKVQCSTNINFEKTADVPIHQVVEIVIPQATYGSVNVFNCSLDVTPHDRPEPIASFAAFRIVVINESYMSLPEISRFDKYLVLGQHAYKSMVFEDDNIKMLKKKTYYKTKSEKAIVESYNQRFTYRGF